MKRSSTYIAVPPGVTIREQLKDRGMSQKEFASRMDMSEKHISRLINGRVQLTPDVAYRLEMVLGLSAKFWSNLEAIYQEKLVKVKNENAMDADKKIARKFPYKEMSKNGWLPETGSSEERVVFLRKFFEVAQLEKLIDHELIPSLVCRRLSITEKTDFALIAWAQKAKIEARTIQTAPIDLNNLKKQLPTIRAMTVKDPSEFCPKLLKLLAGCGIAIVFLPHISGSFLHGATFYDKNKIVLGLTLRGKDADKFWFSLFHEIGHILLGHLSESAGADNALEEAANRFAQDTLIPPKAFESFLQKKDFSKRELVCFANRIGVYPGIVLGRLQKEGHINFNWYNELKTQYKLTVAV